MTLSRQPMVVAHRFHRCLICVHNLAFIGVINGWLFRRRCEAGGATIFGAAVRMAVDGLRGQRLRLRAGVRGFPPDCRAGVACRRRAGVRAVGDRSGSGCVDGDATRSMGGVSAQATSHDRDGHGPFRGHDERACGLCLRSTEFRPATSRVGFGRCGQDRVQCRQRRLSQDSRPAGGPARGQRAVRVHDLGLHRYRTSAGRRGDRAVRAGDDRGGRRAQLSVLRAGDQPPFVAEKTHRSEPARGGPGSASRSMAGGTS